MAKKEYDLDYSIERDIDRLAWIEGQLDKMEKRPTPYDLELFASYILYGKDENGKNSIERHETKDYSFKRYKSYKKKEDEEISLDAHLDNPMFDQSQLKPFDSKIVHKKYSPKILPEDSSIPGMQELQDAIARTQRLYDMSVGKIPPDENCGKLVIHPYRQYQLKHQLVDMKRHQYYLKDAYKPELHFLNLRQPSPQTYDWSQDSAYWLTREEWEHKVSTTLLPCSKNIEDYEQDENDRVKWVVREHHFDWENPVHIKRLLQHYSAIYQQVWDQPSSWGRTLIYDFDRYFDMCGFSAPREYAVLRRIDGESYPVIVEEIKEKFGVSFNISYLCNFTTEKVPKAMANAARAHRLLLETPQEECKCCFACKRWLPRDPLFFNKNIGRRDHLSSNCRACEKKKRGGSVYDNRTKEAAMLEVPNRKTY